MEVIMNTDNLVGKNVVYTNKIVLCIGMDVMKIDQMELLPLCIVYFFVGQSRLQRQLLLSDIGHLPFN